MMRTTLNLPNDVYELAKSLARSKDISIGEALAELVRKGFERAVRIQEEGGFPCFVVPEGVPPITLEQTLAAEDEA